MHIRAGSALPWLLPSFTAIFLASGAARADVDAAGEQCTEPSRSAGVPTYCADSRGAEAPFGDDVRSVRLLRSTTVRSEPSAQAAPLGTIAQDVRTEWTGAALGPGCRRWISIVPRGWVCEDVLEGNWRAPRTFELPRVAEGALVPGTYGSVVGKRTRAYRRGDDGWRSRQVNGAVTVDRRAITRIGKRLFWKTSNHEWIRASAIRMHQPSPFGGYELDVDAGDVLVFVVSRRRPAAPVQVRSEPRSNARVVARLDARTLLSVLEERDGWLRVGERQWLPSQDARRVRTAAPPSGTGCDERWIDVDLDEQVLVAYEGTRPVYTTLVSSGREGSPTPVGLFRIWVKFAEVDMKGAKYGKRYSVARVPWTMFFLGDFALHCAYWHDRFGAPASHGCVNLSPQDARFLYFWSSPSVPLGWTMAFASHDDPGSLVRVRRRPRPDESPAPQAAICVADAATLPSACAN
ncbi:MAG: L,D-transpeptidase family protein [Myxococcales bacterium]